MRQHKQPTLIIISIIAIGLWMSSQLWADGGEVTLEYKLREGEQFREKMNMAFKVAGPDVPGEVQFTILCPTTYVISGISEDGLIEMFVVYQPRVTEAVVEGRNESEELQQHMNALEVVRVKMRRDGHIVESTTKPNLDDSPFVFTKFFSPINVLPSKPVKLNDTWERTVEEPEIGKLAIKSSLTAFETLQGYDCAKLEGEVTGVLYGPDNANMQVKKGKYTAHFAIQEGLLITENIKMDMDVDVPGQMGKISFQSNYTVEFVEKETLKPEQFKEQIAQLSLIEKGIDAIKKGNYTGRTELQKFLTDYPKSQWRDGVQVLLTKAVQRPTVRQEMVVTSAYGVLSPEQAKAQGYITEWMVLGP